MDVHKLQTDWETERCNVNWLRTRSEAMNLKFNLMGILISLFVQGICKSQIVIYTLCWRTGSSIEPADSQQHARSWLVKNCWMQVLIKVCDENSFIRGAEFVFTLSFQWNSESISDRCLLMKVQKSFCEMSELNALNLAKVLLNCSVGKRRWLNEILVGSQVWKKHTTQLLCAEPEHNG